MSFFVVKYRYKCNYIHLVDCCQFNKNIVYLHLKLAYAANLGARCLVFDDLNGYLYE